MKEIERIIDKFTVDKPYLYKTDRRDLAKAIEQYVIKAIPKERTCSIHEDNPKSYIGGCNCLENKVFNECIAELRKGLK